MNNLDKTIHKPLANETNTFPFLVKSTIKGLTRMGVFFSIRTE